MIDYDYMITNDWNLEDDRKCKQCEELELQKEDCADYLMQVIDMLYKTDAFDDYKLHQALYQMAWITGIGDQVKVLNEHSLNVQRKTS